KISNNIITIITILLTAIGNAQVRGVESAQEATDISLGDKESVRFKQEIETTRTRTLPLIDNRNFDSFIEAEDYNDVNIEVLNLDNILYHNFNKDIHKYKAIASYKIKFTEDFYSIVVTIKKGDNKMESILINYTLDGKFLDSILIAHDEIDEYPTRTTTKITQSTLTRSHIFLEAQEERIEESVYRIDVDGTIKELSSEEVLIDKVISQLGLDFSQVNTHLLAAKVNPSNTQETIIVIPEFVDSDNDEYHYQLNSYIVLVNNLTGSITHTYFESSKTNGWESDAIQLSKISIDTAPYIVAKDTRAFGVRVNYFGSSRVNPYTKKTISLFVKSGDALKKVLHNYPVMNYGGEWDTDCEGEFTEEKRILIISEKTTNGYFDIIAKSTITYSANYVPEDGDCESKKEVTRKKTSLKFDGETYTQN
ncbi:hypothetical protein, partial [Maribacter sp.]|uniref:hypothetical protein n=1 Tax=Maribacter sp. TaxID=1897614 RepID=UPI0025BDBE3E